MMAAENFQAKDDFGTTQRVKQFTTSDGVITYTAKTGRAADDFVIDRVIRVTTGSTFSLTITVPDGVYYGQRLLIIFEVEGGTETIDTSVTTGEEITQLSAAGSWSELVWLGSTAGWDEFATGT